MSTGNLPRAHGGVAGTARLRVQPEDFRVDEVLPFTPTGSGEHALVQVEKRNHNTAWVAQQLSRLAGVHPREVSWSGLKDRRAVTTQWFSVQLPGRPDPDWKQLEQPGLRVLDAQRHDRKLRRGTHRINRFIIRLRDLQVDNDLLLDRLAKVARAGAPNYFGEQRLGVEALARAHVAVASGMLPRARTQRAMTLSMLRSEVFNAVLAGRVANGSWNRCLPGELVVLDGTDRLFADDGREDLAARCTSLDVHPSGPLPGSKPTLPVGEAGELEATLSHGYDASAAALARWGVEAGRRSLRLVARELQWGREGQVLSLSFALSRGCYATALLRELVDYTAVRGDDEDPAAEAEPED
jgi:tRNA pseudouridine13 synthase